MGTNKDINLVMTYLSELKNDIKEDINYLRIEVKDIKLDIKELNKFKWQFTAKLSILVLILTISVNVGLHFIK